MIVSFAWRNLWRNKRRTLITTSSIAFAVLLAVVMKSLQVGVFDNLVNDLVGFYSGYIQVHAKGYWDERILDNTFRYDAALAEKVRKQPHVSAVSPRIEQFVLISSGEKTFGVMLSGIDPEKEAALTNVPSKIVQGEYIASDDRSVLVAKGIAKRLGAKVGDTITVLGQGYHGATAAGKYGIRGILSYGSPQLNDLLVFLPLKAAQDFFGGEELVTSLVVGIESPGALNEVKLSIARAVGKNYEVMTWGEMMPEIESHIQADTAEFYLWIGILYMIIAFGVVGTLIMMFAERRYELGMLVAIGMKRATIGKMLVVESLLISFLGTVAGLAISLPIVYYLSVHPIRFGGELAKVYSQFGFEPVFPTAVSAEIFLVQTLIVLAIALVVGLYPIIKMRGLDPVVAMKR